MKMNELETLKTGGLIKLHNENAKDAGATEIKKWGGKVVDLRVRVLAVVNAAETARLANQKDTAVASGTKKKPFGVGRFVNDLLAAGIVDTRVILDRVAEKFPEAKTTGNCVRWYASKAGVNLKTQRIAPTA